MMSIQGGASIAKYLFHLLGPSGAVTLRVGIAGVLLMLITRPALLKFTRKEWLCILVYGISIGGLNLTFYYGIQRIPLGIGVAVEFIGPLGVALFSSRRILDFLWAAFAAAGILLIVPWNGSGCDIIGLLFAAAAGVFWALYIISAGKISGIMKSTDAVACGMCVAALIALPLSFASGDMFKLNLHLLLLGAGVAVFSSALPFTLDLITMRKISPKTFSILQSLQPAFGALSGLVFLGEILTFIQWLSIVFVITASAGATLTAPAKK